MFAHHAYCYTNRINNVKKYLAIIFRSVKNCEMKSDKRSKTSIIPVKLDTDLAAKVRALAQEVGEPDSTIMRMAIRSGLPRVRDALMTLRDEGTRPAPAELRYSHGK